MFHGFAGHCWTGWVWIIALDIVVLIIVASVSAHRRSNHPSNKKSAFDILKERYAKGEIDKEEFEQKKKDL